MQEEKHIERSQKKLQLCTFWLQEQLFGVNILDVKEVGSDIAFTNIFHSSEKICGYINVRGNIHLVLDMRVLMGYEKAKPTQQNRVILFKSNVGEAFGILVDRVADVIEINKDEIEHSLNTEILDDDKELKTKQNLSAGVYKLEENLIVILNSSVFLTSITN